jgi:hypothetical protein
MLRWLGKVGKASLSKLYLIKSMNEAKIWEIIVDEDLKSMVSLAFLRDRKDNVTGA